MVITICISVTAIRSQNTDSLVILAVSLLEKKTLLIQANNDIAVPLDAAEYLHQNIKNSSLQMVQARGHFPHISAPEEVTAAIKIFIQA